MKNAQTMHIKLLGVIVASLLVLPGCDWWSCKKVEDKPVVAAAFPVIANDHSLSLATIDGAPFITEKMFNDEIQEMFKRDPNLQYVANMHSAEEFDKICFDTVMLKCLAAQYVKANGIDQTPEFQRGLANMIDLYTTQVFVNELPTAVTQEDAQAFYDANKAMLMTAPGGVATVGLKFDSEEEAEQFLAQAAVNPELFDGLIEEQNLKEARQDFGMINNISCNVDDAISSAVNSAETFPSLMLVKADDNYWVINAQQKHEPTYCEFEAVKSKIEPVVARQKQVKAIEEAVKDLIGKYNIVVDAEFFTKKNKATAVAMQEAISQYEESLQAQQEELNQESDENMLMTQAA